MAKRRTRKSSRDLMLPPFVEATDRARRFALYRRARIRRFVTKVLSDTVKGVAVAIALALFALVLYRMGLVAQGQSLEVDLLDPLSWLGSVRDLVINFSQFNEWLLLGLAAIGAIGAVILGWRWRRAQAERKPPAATRSPFLLRLERVAKSSRPVIIVATWSVIFLGAWLYQQYLWRVELPVAPGVLGVAFTREAGASVSLADLRGQLTLRGHSGAVALRELPVRLDPADIEGGRALASRIGAKALVIFRREGDVSTAGSSSFVAYVRFTDPGYGLEVPLPQRASDGRLTGIAYRTANGLEVPRLATGDTTRLVEATAGIVLYDAGDYLSAIAHLTAALPPIGTPDEMEPVVRFHLASANALLGRDGIARGEYQAVIGALERLTAPSLQDRLMLASAHNALGNLPKADAGLDAEQHYRAALDIGKTIVADPSLGADPGVFRRVHDGLAESYLGLLRLSDDLGETNVWKDAALKEARYLVDSAEDRRARLRGARASFLAGDCGLGWRVAEDLAFADPDDRAAASLLIRLAALRDRDQLRSVQSDALLAQRLMADPNDVTSLQLRQLMTSLHGLTIDIDLIERSREDAETLLRLDPTDPRPLSDYVDDRRVTVGNYLLAGVEGFGRREIGHVPTFLRLQERWRSDPVVLQGLVNDADLVRTDAVRLALDVDPGSVQARLQLVRLDARLLTFLVTPAKAGGSADAGVRQMIVDVAERGIAAAADLSRSDSGASPRERAEALKLASEIRRAWWYPLLTTEPTTARTVIFQAVDDLEQAKALLTVEPDPTGDTSVEALVYAVRGLTYRMAAGSVSPEETDAAAALLSRAAEADRESADFRERHPQEIEPPPETALGMCAEVGLRAQAAQALAEGRPTDAIASWRTYVGVFGDDPGALIDLGWNEYLSGDYGAALATTARVETLAPSEPLGPANAAVIAAAAGSSTEAIAAVERFIDDLRPNTPASQLSSATVFLRDLGDLANTSPAGREVINSMATRLSEWALEQGPTGFDRYGPVRIQLADAFVRVHLAVGSAAAASDWCDRGLAISTAYSELLAHCAIVDAITGDLDWRSHTVAAIAAAKAYSSIMAESPLASQAGTMATAELARAAQDARALSSIDGAFSGAPSLATIVTMLERAR